MSKIEHKPEEAMKGTLAATSETFDDKVLRDIIVEKLRQVDTAIKQNTVILEQYRRTEQEKVMSVDTQCLINSPVGKYKEHIEMMAKAHAAYVCDIMEGTLGYLEDSGREWEAIDILEIISKQYITAFIHGYGHGAEDTAIPYPIRNGVTKKGNT